MGNCAWEEEEAGTWSASLCDTSPLSVHLKVKERETERDKERKIVKYAYARHHDSLLEFVHDPIICNATAVDSSEQSVLKCQHLPLKNKKVLETHLGVPS